MKVENGTEEILILSYNYKYIMVYKSAHAKFLEMWYEKSEEAIVSMNYW